mmetsp:Transcript_3899/g.16188  ORF Transcript_3899/g.16188 Transcript_3899/m.16188 type:complete len:357 (+) Transcript_3899:1117-2187(+)
MSRFRATSRLIRASRTSVGSGWDARRGDRQAEASPDPASGSCHAPAWPDAAPLPGPVAPCPRTAALDADMCLARAAAAAICTAAGASLGSLCLLPLSGLRTTLPSGPICGALELKVPALASSCSAASSAASAACAAASASWITTSRPESTARVCAILADSSCRFASSSRCCDSRLAASPRLRISPMRGATTAATGRAGCCFGETIPGPALAPMTNAGAMSCASDSGGLLAVCSAVRSSSARDAVDAAAPGWDSTVWSEPSPLPEWMDVARLWVMLPSLWRRGRSTTIAVRGCAPSGPSPCAALLAVALALASMIARRCSCAFGDSDARPTSMPLPASETASPPSLAFGLASPVARR